MSCHDEAIDDIRLGLKLYLKSFTILKLCLIELPWHNVVHKGLDVFSSRSVKCLLTTEGPVGRRQFRVDPGREPRGPMEASQSQHSPNSLFPGGYNSMGGAVGHQCRTMVAPRYKVQNCLHLCFPSYAMSYINICLIYFATVYVSQNEPLT